MKIIILLIIATSCSAFCQCKYMKNETDEFTGATMKSTKWERVAPGVQVLILQHNDVIGLMFYADLDCVSPNDSKAYFKFTDGEVITLAHVSDIQCNEMVALTVSITDHLDKFTTKAISKIRLVGERSMDIEVLRPKYIGDTLNSCFDLPQL